MSLDYRYNIVTHPHELLSFLDVCAYDANAIVCVYECSHPPLGMRLSSPLALLCQQLDYQTRRVHRINANKPVLVKFDSRTGSSTRLIFVVTVLASRYANYGRKKEMYTVVVNSWHN